MTSPSEPCPIPEPEQCCCRCEYLVKDFDHCRTRPKVDLRCRCSDVVGWACIFPLEERGGIQGRWPQHSCGCEMFTRRKREAS